MRSRSSDPGPRLLPDDFRMIRDLIYDHAGLHFEDDAAVLFERRLNDRLQALGLPSYGAYYKYLRFNVHGEAEVEEAVERLTTKETYFFRQEYQLRAFQEELLPRLVAMTRHQRRMHIWSAGCATGEEAYTIAILVQESGLFRDDEVRVIGSDISRNAIARARGGVYRSTSFRATPPELYAKYFREGVEGVEVIESVREMCHFGQLNLLDQSRVPLIGRVDVIFCRNVLIYFDMNSRRKVIDAFYDRLLPGGYLLLGHSESLLNVTTAFELVHLSEDLVYRKPTIPERASGGPR